MSESGEYACRAVDPVSGRESEAARSTIRVSVNASQSFVEITSSEHALTPLIRVVRAKESDNVQLKCSIRNPPESGSVKLKWLKLQTRKEYPVVADLVEYDLPLSNVQNEDAGRYYCVANLDGQQLFDYVDVEVDRLVASPTPTPHE